MFEKENALMNKKKPADTGGQEVFVLLEVRRGGLIEKTKTKLTEKQVEQLKDLLESFIDY